MADPLSIAAGVVGIVGFTLHGAHLLVDDVNRITDAPQTIRHLRTDLESTIKALKAVGEIPEVDWNTLGATVADPSKEIVESCGSACELFRADLTRWTKRIKDGKLSWRDRANVGIFKAEQIKTMSSQLQDCKLTCSAMIGTATLYAALRNGHIIQELKETIEKSRLEVASAVKEQDDGLLAIQQALDEMSVNETTRDEDEDEDKMNAETQLVKREAALRASRNLFTQLNSKLQDDEIKKVSSGGAGNNNVSIGSITNGFGMGVSYAPVSGITFNNSAPPTAPQVHT